VVTGLKRQPNTRLEKLPRMADFALWATACETALWPAGTFGLAYSHNRDEAVEAVIDADPIAAAMRALALRQMVWTGTASELLRELATTAGERIANAKSWPDSARALAGRLRRAATSLREVGVEISFDRKGHGRTRTIQITTATGVGRPEQAKVPASVPSASSALPLEVNSIHGFADASRRTIITDADDRPRAVGSTVDAHPLTGDGETAADDADANVTHASDLGERQRIKWRGRL
jgi:hypothetical protein